MGYMQIDREMIWKVKQQCICFGIIKVGIGEEGIYMEMCLNKIFCFNVELIL